MILVKNTVWNSSFKKYNLKAAYETVCCTEANTFENVKYT